MKKKTFKRIISMLLALVMVLSTLFVCPFIAQAVDTASTLDNCGIDFWADPENSLNQADITAFKNGTKTTMTGAVGVFKRSSSSSNYYLFLPSNADCTNLRVWFTQTTASVNGTPLTSGQATDVFADINEGGISKVYTLTLGSSSYTVTAIKSGDIATVYIDTDSGSISKINASDDHSVAEAGTIMVVQPDGTINYDGIMEKMTGRGNGTWSTTGKKNPYNIKLGTSTSLLGMGKAKKWCLLANSGDSTLIKNQLTYDFADYIGIKYQPHCKPVDLYVNQQYFGSYQLSEKVEIKSNRVNVTDAYENLEIANGTVDSQTGIVTPADLTGTSVASYTSSGSAIPSLETDNSAAQTTGYRRYSKSLNDPNDYTGGYLYELEISNRWIGENAGFCAYNRQGWVIKSCDYATKNMVDYSYDLLYALGSSVYNSGVVPNKATNQTKGANATKNILTGKYIITPLGTTTDGNPAPAAEYQGKKWSDILDADSAVKYYWTQEYFKNMDSSTSSTYFYKDMDSIDSKLYAGPMWDMDNSIGFGLTGERWGHSWTSSTDWYTKNARIYRYISNQSYTGFTTDAQAPLNFYAALATNCSDFWQMAESYWYSKIEPATKILLGEETDPTGTLHSTQYYAETVEKSGTMNNLRHNLDNDSAYNPTAVTSGMNNWFTERNNWIDSQISKIDINSCTLASIPNQVCTGSEITPEVVITYNDAVLVEGTDYTIEYSNNIAASKNASVTITGKGLYTGTKTVNFTIGAGSLVGGSAQISEYAYKGDTLSVSVKNADGNDISQFVTYQWKANGSAISGATESTYTIDDVYEGATITVSVSGDGVNFASVGITSNNCEVLTGNRPTGYSRTIASWNYDYSVDSAALENADQTGATYYYNATGGENTDGASLKASVNAVDDARIKWSGTADLYANDSTSVASDQTPVMGTSKTEGLAWGEYPYFETTVSTFGYEDIHFSAKLGGTKKAPRDWKLQYSLDGVNYKDVEGAVYTIVKNKTMELAFNNVALPSECNNVSSLYIRMVVYNDISIDGNYVIIGNPSGDAAVNNVEVTGASTTSVITKLEAPSIATTSTSGDFSEIFDDESIVINDNNGGADIYYTINDSEPVLYTEAFNPFDSTTAKANDTAVIKAYAQFNDIVSEIAEYTVTFAGVNISAFNYSNYSTNVSNGAVFSTGGIYGESGKMTAYTDGVSQYVPLWNDSNKAFAVSPDDGALWSKDSGFYFEVPTAGYNNISFSCQAYTTPQGPKSVSLEYSIDGEKWNALKTNVALAANGTAEQLFMAEKLPSECSNLAKVYIRVVTTENSTSSGTTLWNNSSHGNLYINNIVVSGDDNGEYKMPYTNKTTDYFGTGVINYYSPSGVEMQYAVTDADSNVILSGAYPATGISIPTINGFNATAAGPYTVSIWAGDDDDKSIVNTRKYYYKGETVTKFNYNDTTKLFNNYVSADAASVSNTSGANAGTLSMYPNGMTAATLSYTGTYGVKVSWAADNVFTASKKLDNPAGNGYWLVETSSAGFTDLTLNLEQLSSNKGPRDWGLAYSLDGANYKYVAGSNVRAISNDATGSTVETYNNFKLPQECDNQDKLYIMIFINGGESVDGTELELITKGNTGINTIELSGIAIPTPVNVTINTVALESKTAVSGTASVDATVTVDGVDYTTENGTVTVPMFDGVTYTVSASVNGTFINKVNVTASADANVTVPVVAVDMNADGIVNAKDYAYIIKLRDNDKKNLYKTIFQNFVNVKDSTFIYAK